jgi:hypothetical protein
MQMARDDRDDLLRRARKLREEARRRQEHVPDDGPAVFRSLRGSARVQKIASILGTANRWLGPIGSLLAWMFGLAAKWFRWAAFKPAGRDAHGEYHDLDFSWRRLCLNTFLTVAALVGLHVLFSAIYYYATWFEETVYVTGKQEIETGELYQFGGCTSLPCSTEADNGKFYLIESSLYFPAMYYPEENVFANIPQQNGACDVEGYGIYFRTLRWLYKSAQLYQHIVDVSCRPYTEDEIRRAVDEGEIVRDG